MPPTAPAMVNAHSHAFQRELRGAAERPAPTAQGSDDFWSWREQMYALAERLDPDALQGVADAAFAEMTAAGYGAVGEFHYLHHGPGGEPYDDPNVTAKALAIAARVHGLAVVLLPAAYARAGAGRPADSRQRRFCDPGVDAYLARVDELRDWARGQDGMQVGVAAHSARAVPASWLERIADYSERHGLVRHVHAAEQRREVEEVEREHGCSPIELLGRTGFLGPLASVVHAIHVDERDVGLLADAATTVIACPTTEGNLGDGYQPALAYRDAGVALAVGSDSQVRIDPFEEVRELETGARREGQTRFGLLAADPNLWATLAANGARSLGLEPNAAGALELDLDHPSLAGVQRDDLGYALATCASVGAAARVV